MSSEKATLIKSLLDTVKGILGSEAEESPSKEPTTVSKAVGVKKELVKSLDEEKRKATFVVLAPDEFDLHGHTYSASEIEKAKDSFSDVCGRPNLAHMMMADEQDVSIVEDYIAPCDMTLGETTVSKGTWIQTWKFNNDSLWEGVKSGYWNGLSIKCSAWEEDILDDN